MKKLFLSYAATLPIGLKFSDFEAEMATLPGKYAPPFGAMMLARGDDGTPLGCVAVRPAGPGDTAELKRLYVVPAERDTGLGKALVETALAEASRLGYREIRLDTWRSMTGALTLYDETGFRPIPAFYDAPVRGTIFLGRSL